MSLTQILNNLNSTATTEIASNTTEKPEHDVKAYDRSLGILFVPFSLIAIFCVLSGVIYYMMKKRRLDQLRHQLVPLYNFDPGEGDDWEAEVLDPQIDPKQPKKLQDYQTIESGTVTSPRL